MKNVAIGLTLLFAVFMPFSAALAHSGNTDSYGCHTCRTNCPSYGLSYGEYHCHNSKGLSQPLEPIRSHYGAGGTGYTEPWPAYSGYSSLFSGLNCPLNSYASGSSCKCNYGYVVSGGSCVSGDSYCWGKTGIFSSYDSLSNSCKCDTGYSVGSFGYCTRDTYSYNYGGSVLGASFTPTYSSCPANSSPGAYDSSKCYCDQWYKLNKKEDACISQTKNDYNEMCRDSFGKNSKWNGEKNADGTVNCKCKNKYEWNDDRTKCEKSS